MKNKELLKTKKRLTIIFTILVFFIAVFLEFIFFTTKYVNTLNVEKKDLSIATNLIINKLSNLNGLIETFSIQNKIFDGRKMKILGPKPSEPQLFLSFLVIDNQKSEIVFNNINEKINSDLIELSLFDLGYNKGIQKHGFYVTKVNIKKSKIDYDIILYKRLKYSFDYYITDLLYFIIFTLLFSIIFYYIGYKFVSKNLEPVEKSLKDMQDFIHNAGHELKTPISIVHGNLQILNELKKYDKKLTTEGINEIDRLNKLIDGLLELSNIGGSNNNQKLSLKTEIEKILEEYSKKINKKNIKINFENNFDLIINANKEYFYILFTNLLLNSIKYTKKGGNINITLSKSSLKIIDNGIGISKENIGRIFDRFYQVDKTRNSKGFGIGLSLVKKILDIYIWKISIESEIGIGTKIEIKF